MMRIDSHTHLGGSRVADSVYTETQWLSTMDKYHLDGIMSYPNPQGLPDYGEAHDRIYRFAQSNPGRVWGVVDLTPTLDDEIYIKEAERCVRELGFVAIKLHPSMHAAIPGSRHCRKVYETARRLKVPVIVHTGTGAPNCLPATMLPIAREYPDLPIVLAHAGAYVYTGEAIAVAQVCDNIYLEPSWCAAHRIREMINKIGIERVMYGSDIPSNVPVELAKVEGANLNETERELYLGGNAVDLYGLK